MKIVFTICFVAVGDRLNEHIIKNICETALVSTLYPRSAIVVVIQEMQNSGGVCYEYIQQSHC